MGDGKDKKTGLGTYRPPGIAVLIRGVREDGTCDGWLMFKTRALQNGHLQLEGEPVLRVGDDALHDSAKRWKRALAVLSLRDACDNKDELGARRAVAALYDVQSSRTSRWATHGRGAVATEFNKRMRSARFVLWLHHDLRLEPGILCPDRKTALFVRAALQDVRVCPSDGNLFVPQRQDQKYCLPQCRERFRKQRFREKQKTRQT
jgi:hypothetical protein